MEVRYNNDQTPIGVFATRYFRVNEPLIYVNWTEILTKPTCTSTQIGESAFIETELDIVKYMRTSGCPNLVLERQFFTPIVRILPGDELTFCHRHVSH